MSTRGLCVFLFVIVLPAHGTPLYGDTLCGVTDSFNGYLTSVVSQSERDRDSSYWFYYFGPETQKLKFTMKFPKDPAVDSDVQKLKFNPKQGYAYVPFNYHWHETDSPSGGLGQLIVTDDTSTCKSPVYFADNGFESTNVPKAIPDFGAAPLQSGIVVKNVDYITKVRVSLYLTHPYDGDLEIYLNAPNGASALLSRRNGGDRIEV